MAKRAVKYSAKMSDAEAMEALQELAKIEISVKSVWRLTQRWGEALKQVEEQEDERANGTVESQATGKVEEKSDPRLGAAMDGAMIYLRGEEWKELKGGCFFEVECMPEQDPETKEWVELGHACQSSYVCHLGGPEQFGQKMWTESKRRKWHRAVDTQVVADGAPWIWNLVGDYFYDAHQVVDWYHAKEHLALAAHLALGEGTPRSPTMAQTTRNPSVSGSCRSYCSNNHGSGSRQTRGWRRTQQTSRILCQPPAPHELPGDALGWLAHRERFRREWRQAFQRPLCRCRNALEPVGC